MLFHYLGVLKIILNVLAEVFLDLCMECIPHRQIIGRANHHAAFVWLPLWQSAGRMPLEKPSKERRSVCKADSHSSFGLT